MEVGRDTKRMEGSYQRLSVPGAPQRFAHLELRISKLTDYRLKSVHRLRFVR
jgi:hypothetical protein